MQCLLQAPLRQPHPFRPQSKRNGHFHRMRVPAFGKIALPGSQGSCFCLDGLLFICILNCLQIITPTARNLLQSRCETAQAIKAKLLMGVLKIPCSTEADACHGSADDSELS